MTRRQALITSAAAAALAQKSEDGICSLTAREMARLMRRKELSAVETLDAHLKRIERINPQVNSIVTLVADQARERAKHCDEAAAKGKFLGILHGLPIAHKDLQDTKGIRTTLGSPIFKDNVPKANSLYADRGCQGAGRPGGPSSCAA